MGADESASGDGLLLHRLGFRSGAIQYFEEIGRFGSHPRMDVGLAALYMVMQIITEQVNQVDGVLPDVLVGVTGK